MKFKLVATDYDDTLLNSSYEVTDFSKEVILKYVAEGGIFVLCTGRMYASIKEAAKKIGVGGIAISYQGAYTCNLDTDTVIKEFNIPHELAYEYIDFVNGFDVVKQLYAGDKLYVEQKNVYTERYSAFCGVPYKAVGDLKSFIAKSDARINKLYCCVREEDCAKLRETAKARFAGRLLVNSSKPWNVEAISAESSKGAALKYVAQALGIKREEILAFGDNYNDLEMIEYAGTGAAVGNAVDALKRAADIIVPTNDENGVAQTILKLCLGE